MKQLDLNLLRLLVALEQTRHLGRAAEGLQMSQSGFSSALGRLREQVGDDLFVRSGAGMRPTARALALAETARAVLQQVEQDVIGGAVFDPASSDATFRLSMSDVAETVFLPILLNHFASHAPRASVQVVSQSISPLHERLTNGEIDLAIGYFPGLEKDAYFRQPLLSHTYACIVRKGHPVIDQGLSRAAYQALGHAVVATSTRSNSLIEAAIERHRLQRRIVLRTPNHLSLPAVICATELIATVPMGTAADLVRFGEIVELPLPFRPPAFPIFQYWHRRTQKDPGCQWLRMQMKSLFSQQTGLYSAQRDALYTA